MDELTKLGLDFMFDEDAIWTVVSENQIELTSKEDFDATLGFSGASYDDPYFVVGVVPTVANGSMTEHFNKKEHPVEYNRLKALMYRELNRHRKIPEEEE